MSALVKKKFAISGMHCSSCAMNIDFDLEDIDGVKSVNTNYARQETEVEFDEEKVGLALILEQIKKTGYTASLK
jgi:copper chaperone CopZ